MHIVVCLKQVLDPDIPARDFKVDPARREAIRGSASLVTNIFCENALELALQIADKEPGTTITAISIGPASVEDTLRKAVALKAATGVHVRVDGVSHPVPADIARLLAATVRKLAPADLILVGRESADWGTGQTGGLLAEELGLPCLSFVDRIERREAGSPDLLLRRQTDTGWERVQATPPVVLSVTNDEHNVPRIPKTRDVMLSFRQTLTTWTPADLGVADAFTTARADAEIADLAVPVADVRCEFATGTTLEERVDDFARRILDVVRSGS